MEAIKDWHKASDTLLFPTQLLISTLSHIYFCIGSVPTSKFYFHTEALPQIFFFFYFFTDCLSDWKKILTLLLACKVVESGGDHKGQHQRRGRHLGSEMKICDSLTSPLLGAAFIISPFMAMTL